MTYPTGCGCGNCDGKTPERRTSPRDDLARVLHDTQCLGGLGGLGGHWRIARPAADAVIREWLPGLAEDAELVDRISEKASAVSPAGVRIVLDDLAAALRGDA